MSAADDDTELRDLLIQNLENSGVLNKLKAEMRAAVFLAMEEQDRMENKSPLVNENLRKCLNSRDGRLMASLVLDFLEVFSLDFSRAVFLPEINTPNGLEDRDQVCKDLGLNQSDLNQNSPLLLELVRRGRQQDSQKEEAEPASLKQDSESRKDLQEGHADGDSFFDDPLPEPQKTYGSRTSSLSEKVSSRRTNAAAQAVQLSEDEEHSISSMRRGRSLSEEEEPPGSPAKGESSVSEASNSRTAASKEQNHRAAGEQNRSFHSDEDLEYDDDFNSHRSSRSELSIGEDIEEGSIEGPDPSEQLDTTLDQSGSQLSRAPDYMEEVA